MKVMMNAKGRRLPKNYNLVYELIRDAGPGHHFSTQNLYDLARQRQPRIGYSTVHRALQRLGELEMVGKVSFPGVDAVAYEIVSSEHAHFHCERCGTILDIEYALPPRTLAAVSMRHSVEVHSAAVALSGTCATCLAPAN